LILVGGARFELATNGLKVLMLRKALLPLKNLADLKNGVLRHVQSENQMFSHQRPVTGQRLILCNFIPPSLHHNQREETADQNCRNETPITDAWT
jgi:hypothetical protein